VPELRPLTPEQLRKAEAKLRNPAPGSRIEAAKQSGVDLTLLVEQLRLTPDQRVRRMLQAVQAAEGIRGAARRRWPPTTLA